MKQLVFPPKSLGLSLSSECMWFPPHVISGSLNLQHTPLLGWSSKRNHHTNGESTVLGHSRGAKMEDLAHFGGDCHK